MKLFLALAVLTITTACQGPTDVIGGRVDVRATPPHLQLTNHSSAAVYYQAMEGGFAISANWAPCNDPEKCHGVAPGERFDLPYADIAGFKPGPQTVLVYWWHLLPAKTESGFRVDSIRAVPVEVEGT